MNKLVLLALCTFVVMAACAREDQARPSERQHGRPSLIELGPDELPLGWQQQPQVELELGFDSPAQPCPPCPSDAQCEPCRPPFALFYDKPASEPDARMVWVAFTGATPPLVANTRYRLKGHDVRWPPHGNVLVCTSIAGLTSPHEISDSKRPRQ